MQINNKSLFSEDVPHMDVYQDEPFQQKVGFDLTPKKPIHIPQEVKLIPYYRKLEILGG